MSMSNTRRAATLGLAAAALTTGVLTASAPANASTVVPASGAITSNFQVAAIGNGWHYYDSYFWGKECNRVGNAKINSGEWKAYRCMGDWWNDYDLWYQA